MEVIAPLITADVHAAMETMAQIHGDRSIHMKKVAAGGATAKGGQISRQRHYYNPYPEKHPSYAIRLPEV